MHITLYGPWNKYNNYSEQYYMIVCRYRGYWLILETGWNRVGKPSQYSKFLYVPFHTGAFIENKPDNGKLFIYTDFKTYIRDCTINPSAIVDGVPMLWWATSCAIN